LVPCYKTVDVDLKRTELCVKQAINSVKPINQHRTAIYHILV